MYILRWLFPNTLQFQIHQEQVIDRFYNEFALRFSPEMFMRVCDLIHAYNQHHTYNMVYRNCQHFTLDILAALELNCQILNSELLKAHIYEFVLDPTNLVPTKMGDTPQSFILFAKAIKNRRFLYDSIFTYVD